ncbi:MAG TPA: hypothetical protein DD670_03150 [Planctomycetaceae bacterium]|nr:hypothetical protein [Planctomycetaceae bacterium]
MSAEERLSIEQQRIADKYKHLEEVLLRMAELTADTDPRRAEVLRRAVAESKSRMVGVQFEQMVNLLATGRLSRALDNQKDLDRDLAVLLELLLSENRDKQVASEKAKIRDYIKRVGQIIRQQKSIQGRTAGGADPKNLSGEQESLAKKTGDLAKDVKSHEDAARGGASGGNENPDKPGGDEKSDEGKSLDDSKKDQEVPEAKPAEKDGSSDATPSGDAKPAETPSEGAEGGNPAEGAPSSPAGESQPTPTGESSPSSPAPPSRVQKSIEAAEKRMREAREKLEKAQRDGALEDQEEAIRELEQAKAELEEILRQLREEEIERMLTLLEARFKKMLDLQRAVYKDTKRLDGVPGEQRGHDHEIEASRLSRRQSQIVLEADKALLLLREDGTSVAFPEALSQTRDDMRQVMVRLARAEVGSITQSIEEDVITALEEMLAALEKALEDQEARRGRPTQSQGAPGDPALVDTLSELRMIRALQMRVNQRTVRYAKLVDGEQAEQPDLIEALRRLAKYQSRIHEITRDLESGKNQ